MHRALLASAFMVWPTAPMLADETPKQGGILTYMIPADAPPSFDGHREATFATVHAVAPFYSVLVRVNPANPASTTDFVCDVCTEMPAPTDGGRTWTFTIRGDVRFTDGATMTADDVAASWNHIVNPPAGVVSARQGYYAMIDKIEATDPRTVVFRLKYATSAFVPALADPYAFIYKKEILDRDPRWFEKNILGSGPFRFKEYATGQSISGGRNPDYYRPGLPHLDGFTGIFADKQATRVAAIRADQAAIEFRGFPPATRDELKTDLGDRIAVQESDWNCGNPITLNHKRKPFDDVRVRRALTLAIDRWNGAPAMAKISVMKTVGGVAFPGSPLAATKEELQQLAGFWPDIEKSRAEARRLLKEAGQENLSFELLNRNVDQPYKFNGLWVIDEWSKIGVKVTQRVLQTGPFGEAVRNEDFAAVVDGDCQNIVNPLLDGTKYLPHTVSSSNYGNYEDDAEIELYDKLLRETDFAEQRQLMRQFEKYVLDTEAHAIFLLWRYRIVPYRSYVKGFKISPSHYVNQDLSTIWLDK
ncbi:MAG: ABC transporter substrate-binding protein [Alphaproteobacteria bacterium]|nr:ABC transporter substrate-binding protein [Alphaproteobacteria bacterium]MBV9555072.1 ABC transporter substrate-binding protein [Alphaproteobacteria bacterium]